MTKATPTKAASHDKHNRVRTDKIDKTGAVTRRHAGRLHHIGVGRTHKGTLITMPIQDLNITIIDSVLVQDIGNGVSIRPSPTPS